MKLPGSLSSKITIKDIESDLRQLLNEQSEFEETWRSMVNFILNARGHFISDYKGKKKNLISKAVLNNAAKEAVGVLAAALQSGLTPANSNWIDLEWEDEEPKQVEFLQQWLQDVQKITLEELASSNFYDTTFTYYEDVSVFCNAAIHSGEGVDTDLTFDNYSVGEYVFRMDEAGKPDPFIQVRWVTLRTLKEKYGEENLPDVLKLAQDDQDLSVYYPLVKAVYKIEHRGNPYVSIHYVRGGLQGGREFNSEDGVLLVKTYESCPNHIGRWNLLSGEDLAIGPGFDALSHARRLQEQERSLQMLIHKLADPAHNIPAELRGKANTLPGGENYLRGDRSITPIMDARNTGVNEVVLAIDRTEERIGKIFYNDVFLTNVRDPNASPLRTGEVNKRSEEALIKLGPVVGRIFNQTLRPIVERSINILLKAGRLPEIPDQYLPLVGNYKIKLVSPLAQSMKLLEGRAIQGFLQNVTGIAQFFPNVLDKLDEDMMVDKFADVTGVPLEILKTKQQVEEIREARAQQAARDKQESDALLQSQFQNEQRLAQSQVAKNLSDAGAQVSDVANEAPIQ